jgi:hypothetical protein
VSRIEEEVKLNAGRKKQISGSIIIPSLQVSPNLQNKYYLFSDEMNENLEVKDL